MENGNNILIGLNAGIELTTESNILHLVCKDLDIDYKETMSEREYEMINMVVRVMHYYIALTQKETIETCYPIYNSGCSACITGDCSIHIGHKAGRL